MIGTLLSRRAGAAICGLAAVALLPATTAHADGTHTQTETQNIHGTQTGPATNPCNGDPMTLTTQSNSVFHVTSFSGSDEVWFTFTEEDNGTALDQVSGVTFTGHSTTWGNQNVNERNSNTSFTQSMRITGSDGTTLTVHEVMHVTVLPSGQVSVSFDKLDQSLTCG